MNETHEHVDLPPPVIGMFAVELESFNGPIDLLLHLVKKNALPIEKLSLAIVAEQYIAAIERARNLDLEVAAEYLVIASTLLSIKTSIVTNSGRSVEIEGLLDDGPNSNSPHEELLQRLRDAAIYKDAAAAFAGRPMLELDVFSAAADNAVDIEPPLKPHDLALLAKAFERILKRVSPDVGNILKIQIDSVTVVERMMRIVDHLATHGRASLEQLIFGEVNRASVVTAMLAILELCKRALVTVEQPDTFADILICYTAAVSVDGAAWDDIKTAVNI